MDRQRPYEQGLRAVDEWRRTHAKQSLDAAVEAFRAILALPWDGSGRPEPAECVRDMLTALNEGSEIGLAGYTDEAISVTSQLLEQITTMLWLWTNRGYNLIPARIAARTRQRAAAGDSPGAAGDEAQPGQPAHQERPLR